VGIKMIVSQWYHINALISLGFIAVILTITVVASLRATRSAEAAADPSDVEP
jgi:hypothetical protein